MSYAVYTEPHIENISTGRLRSDYCRAMARYDKVWRILDRHERGVEMHDVRLWSAAYNVWEERQRDVMNTRFDYEERRREEMGGRRPLVAVEAISVPYCPNLGRIL